MRIGYIIIPNMANGRHKEWRSSEWRQWLKMRDAVVLQYFDALRKYHNLPAFDHLVMRDLKRTVDPQLLKLTYTAVAPPENTILHNWQEDVPRVLEIPEGEDGDADELEEKYPELETPVDGIPDDARIYQILGQLRLFSLRHRDLMDEWSSLMPSLLETSEGGALAMSALMLCSQCLLCVNVCKDAVCAWNAAKASALLQHASWQFHGFASTIRQQALRPKITPRVFQLFDVMNGILDKTELLLKNLPQKDA